MDASVYDAPPIWQLIRNAWRRHWLIISVASFLGTVISLIIALSLTPIYSAEAVLLFDQQASGADSDATTKDLSDSQQKAWLARSQLAVLRSIELADKVLNQPDIRQQLQEDPLFLPGAFDSAKTVIVSKLASIVDAIGFASSNMTPKDEYSLTRSYLDRLDIIQDKETYVLRVSFEASSPALAARIANTHAKYYLDMLRSRHVEVLDDAFAWLSHEVAAQRERLIAAEQSIKTFREQTGVVDIDIRRREGAADVVGQTSLDVSLSEVSASLATAQAELAAVEARQIELWRLQKYGQVEAIAEMFGTPLLQNLRERYAQESAKVADYSQEMGKKHPALLGAASQKAQLRSEIDAEVARIARGLQGQAEIARGKVKKLSASLAELKEESLAAETNGAELRRLKQEVESERSRYDSVLQKQKAYERARDLAQADAALVSPALPPKDAIYPNKPLFILFGFVFSAGIALLWSSWRIVSRDVVHVAHDINEQLRVPCLSLLPEVPGTTTAGLDRSRLEYALYNESVRRIKIRLALHCDGMPLSSGQVLLVTSSLPNEGKTTFCNELGRVVAISGIRCLVVSTEHIDGRESAGGQKFAVKQIASSTPLYSTAVPFQTQPSTGGEKLISQLREWRTQFDLIIVDAPPVSASVDVLIIAPIADTTILLARIERTPMALLKTAVNDIFKSGGQLSGIVATFAHLKSGRGITPSDFAYYFQKNMKYYRLGSACGDDAQYIEGGYP